MLMALEALELLESKLLFLLGFFKENKLIGPQILCRSS